MLPRKEDILLLLASLGAAETPLVGSQRGSLIKVSKPHPPKRIYIYMCRFVVYHFLVDMLHGLI